MTESYKSFLDKVVTTVESCKSFLESRAAAVNEYIHNMTARQQAPVANYPSAHNQRQWYQPHTTLGYQRDQFLPAHPLPPFSGKQPLPDGLWEQRESGQVCHVYTSPHSSCSGQSKPPDVAGCQLGNEGLSGRSAKMPWQGGPFLPWSMENVTNLLGACTPARGGSTTKRYMNFDDETGRLSVALFDPIQLPSSAEFNQAMEMQPSGSLEPSSSDWREFFHTKVPLKAFPSMSKVLGCR